MCIDSLILFVADWYDMIWTYRSLFDHSLYLANQNIFLSWWWLNCQRICPIAQAYFKPIGQSKSRGQVQSQGVRKYISSIEVEGKGRDFTSSTIYEKPMVPLLVIFAPTIPPFLFSVFLMFSLQSQTTINPQNNGLLPHLLEQVFRKTYTHFSQLTNISSQ